MREDNKKLLKPWSISTTVRNPERLRGFLQILKTMEGSIWDSKSQTDFQIKLIQHKIYGAGSKEFYNNLTKKQADLMDDPNPITIDEATTIFNAKKYEDPPMRGRQSFNPLKKMGLAFLDSNKRIQISSFGEYFLSEDYDIPEIFFRSFLKWQLPNPASTDYKSEDGYNTKPFICILHLINEVNNACRKKQIKEKGISRTELMLFGLTLIDYTQIHDTANRIVSFRIKYESLKNEKLKKELIEKHKQILANTFIIKNLVDYADNAIRYFKLTRYLTIRGDGYYIDLEPRRIVEIKQLLDFDNGSALEFDSKDEYEHYIQNINLPTLPWQEKNNLIEIASEIIEQIRTIEKSLDNKMIFYEKIVLSDFESLNAAELIRYNNDLRSYRRELQDIETSMSLQVIEEVEKNRDLLKNIYQTDRKKSVELERLVTLSMIALNDTLEIKPNYPIGDDNQPLFTAPANKPDIECYYESFNAICEVTMLTDRQQWYSEGQPVMRHLRDFEDKQKDDTYCLFIAPKLHRDTINTYWTAVKYEYEGRKQKIVPLTINQFSQVIDTLIERKKQDEMIYHSEILELLNNIISVTNSSKNSEEWISGIPEVIENWQKRMVS